MFHISTYRSPSSLGPRTIKSEPGKKVVWKLLWALKAQDNFMHNRIRHFWVLYLNAAFGIQAICWRLLFMFITNKEQGEEKQTAIAEADH